MLILGGDVAMIRAYNEENAVFAAFRGPCALLFARAVYFAIVTNTCFKAVI